MNTHDQLFVAWSIAIGCLIVTVIIIICAHCNFERQQKLIKNYRAQLEFKEAEMESIKAEWRIAFNNVIDECW